MSNITILVGPPGSGKSTYANNLIYNDGDHGAATIRVSQDDQGKVGHMDMFKKALENNQDIIVDRMGFNKEQRDRYLVPAKAAGYRTKIVVFHAPLETCLARCNARENHPTIKNSNDASRAVNFFFSNYERVSDDEAMIVERLGWVGDDGESVVVCDLDGTLCNIEHRRHFVRPSEDLDVQETTVLGPVVLPVPKKKFKKNWPAFFAGIKDDTVNNPCAKLLKAMAWSGYGIVYCSGRGDNERKATVEWLSKHKLDWFVMPLGNEGYKAPLYMRGRHDSRRDDIVKEIILDFEILTKYTPVFMIDDRDQVVAMWRKRGFTCLQIDYGNF